ncbi:hypothetical protein WJX72_007666 [[Myrmecia] bisecta]|uniref:Vps72/YL1 C-terminal domain-containing protein n=1 Tax=[Myrmecia] bisecta TaxID=41462 RepID=A0AAW1Q5L3_9CHLO
MGTLLAEDSGDEEFWNQDYFQEEVKDEEYKTESEEEDDADTDFSEQEVEDDDEEGKEVEERTKRKTLKPPGATTKKPAAKAAAGAAGQPSSPRGKPVRSPKPVREDYSFEAPTLRKSTRQRVEEAEKERQRVEQVKPRRQRQAEEYRLPTQEELLAEAALTEIENTKSLQMLMAQEEETKKKASVKKGKYSGPLIRYYSKRTEEGAMVHLQILNMPLPADMRQKAPPPPAPLRCVITGRPARYRDPVTGEPYADLAAFQQLRLPRSQRTNHHPGAAARGGQKPSKRRRGGSWGQTAEDYSEGCDQAPGSAPAHLDRQRQHAPASLSGAQSPAAAHGQSPRAGKHRGHGGEDVDVDMYLLHSPTT